MTDLSRFAHISPYVRMVRLKRATSLTGKWRDIDNVFTYIAAGSGDFIVNGVRYTLNTGNAIVIPPYQAHVILSQGEEPLVQYIFHFDFFETPQRRLLVHKDVLEEEDEAVQIPTQEQLLEQRVAIAQIPEEERNDLMRCFLLMMREFQEDRPGRGLLLKAASMELLVTALRCSNQASTQQAESSAKKTKSFVLIEKAIQYISGCDPQGKLDNESIAMAVGVTPNYLTALFQEFLGMPLHKYIINYKIERAQQYLLSGRHNVTETAELAGFSNVYVFSKCFRNLLGISPSEFMNQTVSREQLLVQMSPNSQTNCFETPKNC